jgi:hypothetical protein
MSPQQSEWRAEQEKDGANSPDLPRVLTVPRAHATRLTVVFYGSKIFCRKTAQLCETLCETELVKTSAWATVRKPMKTRAKTLS